MGLIIWTDKFSVGCDYIDNQHKKLVNIINQLHDTFLRKSSRNELTKILTELVDYTKYHFSAEEDMMREHNFGPSEEHIQQHKAFVEKLGIFKKRHELGDNVLGFDMMNFLKDWLLNHIMGTDMKYSEKICKNVE